MALAQTTQPALPPASAILVSVGICAAMAAVKDLQVYVSRPDKSVGFDWATFGATVAAGALTGLLTALGVRAAGG